MFCKKKYFSPYAFKERQNIGKYWPVLNFIHFWHQPPSWRDLTSSLSPASSSTPSFSKVSMSSSPRDNSFDCCCCWQWWKDEVKWKLAILTCLARFMSGNLFLWGNIAPSSSSSASSIWMTVIWIVHKKGLLHMILYLFLKCYPLHLRVWPIIGVAAKAGRRPTHSGCNGCSLEKGMLNKKK